jgi:NAD(P)H dehydrogenase (quinone)
MKHVVVFAHPNKDSFTASVTNAYAEAAASLGHSVVVRDLYRMDFDPRLSACELPFSKHFAPPIDVMAERNVIKDANVYALVYPLWLDAPPAMLKGYLERVFGYGFAYSNNAEPLLKGRKLITFSSSGAPLRWVRQTGDFEALQKLFDEHFAEVCGLNLIDHMHSGGIVPGISEAFVASRLNDVRQRVKQHFFQADAPKQALK